MNYPFRKTLQMKTPDESNTTSKQSRVYTEKQATNYDEKRFGTAQGQTIHKLETHQLELAIAKLNPGAKILEIGAGTCRFSIELARRGFDVVALEPSAEMLGKGKEKSVGIDNIEFLHRFGNDTGFNDDTFDFVFSARVLNRLDSKKTANEIVREKVRVTKPGGYIYMDIAAKGFPLPRPGNPVLYSTGEISDLAKELGCTIIIKRGMFVLSSQLIAKLPSFMLPIWAKLESALSRPLYGLSSKSAVVLQKNS